jgi:cell division protein FtsB
MIRVNLLKSKVAGILKAFGPYIVVALGALFVWQAFFGASGALSLIKAQNEAVMNQLKIQAQQMELLNKQISMTESNIQVLKDQQEAARQHTGTYAREEYHPAMKRVKEQNGEEQIEEVARYNRDVGLSD